VRAAARQSVIEQYDVSAFPATDVAVLR
jgi:hypothetical protein